MTWEEITKELFEEKTTKRFQIIHLGNPYDFVVKDHNTNKTYGTLQGDDKSLMELLNELHEENQQIKTIIKEMYETERTALGRSVLKQLLEQIK